MEYVQIWLTEQRASNTNATYAISFAKLGQGGMDVDAIELLHTNLLERDVKTLRYSRQDRESIRSNRGWTRHNICLKS